MECLETSEELSSWPLEVLGKKTREKEPAMKLIPLLYPGRDHGIVKWTLGGESAYPSLGPHSAICSCTTLGKSMDFSGTPFSHYRNEPVGTNL